MDHDHRLVLAVDLLQHGVGQVLVDDVVAELERLHLVAADVRRVAQVPQVVLDEPEHRVGEDVVEAVVGVGVRGHEAHADVAAVRRRDLEGLAAVLLGISTSASVMAEAIQIASRWEASPISAVTRPPVPRLTEPSSWYGTGPRLETRRGALRTSSSSTCVKMLR